MILNEAALRRPLRDLNAMARQLDALVVTGRQHNVQLRVLPLAAGLPRWSAAPPFVLFDFPAENVRAQEPSTVYMDGPCGAVYLDRPHEIETYEDIWRGLVERVLDEDESGELITALAKERSVPGRCRRRRR